MKNKILFSLLLTIIALPAFADECEKCGTYVRNSSLCRGCRTQVESEASKSKNQMMMGVLSMMGQMQAQMAAAEEKARIEREKARIAKEKQIAEENRQIMQKVIVLRFDDVDEGRHNLSFRITPVPATRPLMVLVGKDKEGRLAMAALPNSSFAAPKAFQLYNQDLPHAVDIMFRRESSTANVKGAWVIRNVPFSTLISNGNMLICRIKLVSEDELQVTLLRKDNGEPMVSRVLVAGEGFDYAYEAGVDGKGLSRRNYSRGLGSGNKKNKKRRGLSF